MRRLFCLFGVVLSIVFSTPFTVATMIAVSANENVSLGSTAQEDLNAFGLTEEDYVLDPESNRQVSCFLFVEDIEEKEIFYYLYLYDPKAFTTIPVKNYMQIQISHLTSNFLELLDDDESVERALNYYDLTFMSCSDNGTIAKFLVNDLKFASPKTFRRYQIRQISYSLNNKVNYFVFGDEYLYETLEDGSTKYEYKKMDYITLYNTECSSFYSSYATFWESLPIAFDYGSQQAFFYGFSFPKDLDIDKLIDITFSYNYKMVKGYSHSPDSSLYSGFLLDFDDPYRPSYGEKIYVQNEKIEHEDVSIEGSNNGFIFTDSYKVEFDRIALYNEMVSNENESFSSYIAKNFKDCEYIINFVNFKYKAEKRVMAGSIFDNKYDSAFRVYLRNNNSGLSSEVFYEITKYDCTSVEVINLTFNSEGKIYNINVIVPPIDSKGDFPGSANPSIWDKILELFYKFRDWLMEIFGLGEVVATITAVVLILLGILGIYELVKTLFVRGSATFISKLCSTIFNGLKVVLKGLFSVFYYLLIYPFKVIFRIGG